MSILKLKKQTKTKIDMINIKNYVPQLVFRCFQHKSKFLFPNYEISKKIILAHSIRAKNHPYEPPVTLPLKTSIVSPCPTWCHRKDLSSSITFCL